ncbi:MAG: copper amine oxidase N-terminal domain-containing protein [Heliobacteriaceae bacterium]|nr:copper amine oxidase N-terminal domain-containing protein [Heliobacteriaceae bacterium]
MKGRFFPWRWLAVFTLICSVALVSVGPAAAETVTSYKTNWVEGFTSDSELDQMRAAVENYITNEGDLKGLAANLMLGFGGYQEYYDNRAAFLVHFIGRTNPEEGFSVSPVRGVKGQISFGKLPDGYHVVNTVAFQLRRETSPERWVVEACYRNQPNFSRIGFMTNARDGGPIVCSTLVDPKLFARTAVLTDGPTGFTVKVPYENVQRAAFIRLQQISTGELAGLTTAGVAPLRAVRVTTNPEQRDSSVIFTAPFIVRFEATGLTEPNLGYWDANRHKWVQVAATVETEEAANGQKRYVTAEVRYPGEFALFPAPIGEPVEDPGVPPSPFDSLDLIKGIRIDDKAVNIGVAKPFIRDGRVMVPVRLVSEALGCKVNWEPVEEKVDLYRGDRQVIFWVNQKRVITNGPWIAVDVPAQFVGNHVVVPLRFLAQGLGFEVSWDARNRIVDIKTGK